MEFEPNKSCSSSSNFYSVNNSDMHNPEIIQNFQYFDVSSKLCENEEKTQIKSIYYIHQAGFKGLKIINKNIFKDSSDENPFKFGMHKGRDINNIHHLFIQKIKKQKRRRSIDVKDVKNLRRQKKTKSLNSQCYSIEKRSNLWFQKAFFQSKGMLEKGKKLLQNNSINMSDEQQIENLSKETQQLIQSLTQEDINQLQKSLVNFSQNAKKICLNYHLKNIQGVLDCTWDRVELIEVFGDELDWTYWNQYFFDPFIFPDLKAIKCKTTHFQMFKDQMMENSGQFLFESHGFNFIVIPKKGEFQ